MPLRLQLVILVTLGALAAGGWWWLVGKPGEAGGEAAAPRRAAAARVVVVAPVAFALDRVTLRLIGTGRAIRSAAIHPKVAGEVVEVGFHAEQRVKAGQPLLRLDSKHQRLSVRLAKVALEEARRDVARMERLAPSGHASRARLDTSRSEAEAAAIRLEQAKAELADRVVRAPFDGVLGLTEIEVGDRVDEDTTIASIDDSSQILVEFNLPEDYAGRVAVGDGVAVRPWSMPGAEIAGTITATDSRIGATMRSLKVRARIANPDGRIRPGSSFEVRLEFTGRAYPRIKEVAVLWSRDGAYLWRVTDGKAEKVFVELVRRDQGHVLVDGPLREGDEIVVEGVQGLRAGRKLRVRPEAAPGPPATRDTKS